MSLLLDEDDATVPYSNVIYGSEEDTYNGEVTISQFSNDYIKGTFSFVGYYYSIPKGEMMKAVVQNGKFEGKVSCFNC